MSAVARPKAAQSWIKKQTFAVLLDCCHAVLMSLSARVARYFWAGGGTTQTIIVREKSLECAKTPKSHIVLAC